MRNITMGLQRSALSMLRGVEACEAEEVGWQKQDGTLDFRAFAVEFEAFHRDPVNVAAHLLTTPVGLLGFFCLLRYFTNTSTPGVILVGAYVLSVVPALPVGAFLGTVLLSILILLACRRLEAGWKLSCAMLVAGYMLQDVAHYVTGEATFQGSYSDGGHVDINNLDAWTQEFTKHVYYLLPLCVQVALPFLLGADGVGTGSWTDARMPVELQRVYEHAGILMPLLFWVIGGYCLDSKNTFCMHPAAPYKARVLQCNIRDDAKKGQKRLENRKSDLKKIRDWAIERMPSEFMSTHWWATDLDEECRSAFERCADSAIIERMFREQFDERHYCLDKVSGMNEVYVTGKSRDTDQFNSDQIFYAKHVDGPFGLMPYCSVFRCIVGMDKNMTTSTVFPTAIIEKNCCEGDVIGFDFNREPHFIVRDATKEGTSDKHRVVLKLHYCVYPRILSPLGWLHHRLNVNYNITFRALFLKTINPQTWMEKFMASQVVLQTWCFNTLETVIGQKNIVYLLTLTALWRLTGLYETFLVLTSFVHYGRYISTYYTRTDVDFGCFQRDVLLFKSVAVAQLFLYYLCPAYMSGVATLQPRLDLLSLGMVGAGYVTSMLATKALGIDRTYFGAELGMPNCEPKWIDAYPYGYIPHPMILSQMFALCGFMTAEHFRAAAPWWLVPTHLALYAVHMAQEHWDVHNGKAAPLSLLQAQANEKVNAANAKGVEEAALNKAK